MGKIFHRVNCLPPNPVAWTRNPRWRDIYPELCPTDTKHADFSFSVFETDSRRGEVNQRHIMSGKGSDGDRPEEEARVLLAVKKGRGRGSIMVMGEVGGEQSVADIQDGTATRGEESKQDIVPVNPPADEEQSAGSAAAKGETEQIDATVGAAANDETATTGGESENKSVVESAAKETSAALKRKSPSSSSSVEYDDNLRMRVRTRAAAAGLNFPVDRIGQDLRQKYASTAVGAPVYMAAVLEYLTTEILELAGNAANETTTTTTTDSNGDYSNARIAPQHIADAVWNDEELRCMSAQCMPMFQNPPRTNTPTQNNSGPIYHTPSTRAREVYMMCVKRQQEEGKYQNK